MKVARYIFRWHHWCGLIVGLFLLLMSITGSILVFSEEFETLEERSAPHVDLPGGMPSVDASLKKVRNMYPDWEVRLYHLPQVNRALEYDLRQEGKSRKIYAHPVTGEILEIDENANNSFQRRLLLLHYTLFAGTAGKITVFFTGTLFLISLITGIIVYRRSVFKVLSGSIHFNKKTTRSFYSSLHRIIGVWSLVFNLLIVTTGLILSGQIALAAIKGTAVKGSVSTEKAVDLPADAAVQKIQEEYPEFVIHMIRIRPGANTLQISGRFRSDPAWYGKYGSGVTVGGNKDDIQAHQFMRENTRGARLLKMASPFHFGNYGGVPLKIVYCLFGLTPGFLSISGFIVWRRRKRRRKNPNKVPLHN